MVARPAARRLRTQWTSPNGLITPRLPASSQRVTGVVRSRPVFRPGMVMSTSGPSFTPAARSLRATALKNGTHHGTCLAPSGAAMVKPSNATPRCASRTGTADMDRFDTGRPGDLPGALVPSAGDIVRNSAGSRARAPGANWRESPGRRGDAPAQGASGAHLGPDPSHFAAVGRPVPRLRLSRRVRAVRVLRRPRGCHRGLLAHAGPRMAAASQPRRHPARANAVHDSAGRVPRGGWRGTVGHPCPNGRARPRRGAIGRSLVHRLRGGLHWIRRCGRRRGQYLPPADMVHEHDARAQRGSRRDDRVHAPRALRQAAAGRAVGHEECPGAS